MPNKKVNAEKTPNKLKLVVDNDLPPGLNYTDASKSHITSDSEDSSSEEITRSMGEIWGLSVVEAVLCVDFVDQTESQVEQITKWNVNLLKYLDEIKFLQKDSLKSVVGAARCLHPEALMRISDVLSEQLAVFRREIDKRRDETAEHYKRQHRSLVDVEDRLNVGDIITSESGAEISYTYSGVTWEMSEGKAISLGRPELAGRTVRYAYGKPIHGLLDHRTGRIEQPPTKPIQELTATLQSKVCGRSKTPTSKINRGKKRIPGNPKKSASKRGKDEKSSRRLSVSRALNHVLKSPMLPPSR